MTDEAEILALARQMAIAHFKPGEARERGLLGGSCDHGTDITRFVPAAEAQLIRNRLENTEIE
jgi:hypothetical protein